MKLNIVFFTAIFALVCYVSVTEAGVDCDKPPPPVAARVCCPAPDLNNEELMEACAEFAGPPMSPTPITGESDMLPPPPLHRHRRPPPPHAMYHKCFAECLFNKTEILDEKGELRKI
ncbi:uncharacterized protein [Eurosta solidaginis]|uniref:uncharacterized protein isoform X2 n=1 Tax=Eurosta solidaginis TaxID=178769 RepID=UPI00353120B7